MKRTTRSRLKAGVALATIFAQLAVLSGPAGAFCGFYVAQADSKMFNHSSKVVLARDGQQTSITMASDYEGKPNDFALVVPVPTFIEKSQISVVDTKTIDHLDSFTQPRLVQYFDEDPCRRLDAVSILSYDRAVRTASAVPAPAPTAYAGVKVEARYDVAEYDISILSAEQSDGLIRYLTDNGYKIPAGAEPVVNSYIRQKMHFFVAKVNVQRLNDLGRAYLKPLQVRYETAKFMLPLRLGTVNANGPQDLTIYALTRRGRVEASNYRNIKVPTNVDVPLFVANDFPNVYKAAFDRAVARENMHGVFVEYAWNMGWCDPCAAPPITNSEMSELGASWIPGGPNNPAANLLPVPTPAEGYVTRLHVRYDARSFPEDLNFIETSDHDNFQARYVMHHPFQGGSCAAAKTYRDTLPVRFKQEAENLANLTGWSEKDIVARMAANGQPISGAK
ncbi:MAG TPA: DUF2330 domain-containing protein [Xanthobacteraceae bacterium]|nr:DUF2330 domain-containing protein [Xanthobacteraceae bacterium]